MSFHEPKHVSQTLLWTPGVHESAESKKTLKTTVLNERADFDAVSFFESFVIEIVLSYNL